MIHGWFYPNYTCVKSDYFWGALCLKVSGQIIVDIYVHSMVDQIATFKVAINAMLDLKKMHWVHKYIGTTEPPILYSSFDLNAIMEAYSISIW